MKTRRVFPEFVPCRYTTSNDLQQRLDQTICRYDGRPVYVRVSVASATVCQMILYQWPDTSTKIGVINPDDPLFDISMFDLGYMNYIYDGKNTVLYPYRTTGKKYKQGTCMSHVNFKTIDGNPDVMTQGQPCQSIGFIDMIMGNYPDDFSSVLNGTTKEVAVSPDLAVKIDDLGVLEYYWRTTKVAIKVPGQPVHRLETDYSWVIDKVLGAYL